MHRYVTQFMDSAASDDDDDDYLHYISKPLDPNYPKKVMAPIGDPEQLKHYKNVSYTCKDQRHEGTLCSFLKSNDVAAAGETCRSEKMTLLTLTGLSIYIVSVKLMWEAGSIAALITMVVMVTVTSFANLMITVRTVLGMLAM